MFIPLIGFFVIWFLALKWKGRHFDRLYQQLKSSKPRLPFIGHVYLFIYNKEETMKQLQSLGREAVKAGGITAIWIARKLYINVADPIVAEIILKSCLEKDDVVKCFHIATGDGSIFASVKTWRPRRKYLAPTFNMMNLNSFVKNFSEQSCVLAEMIQRAMGKGPISLWKMYSLYSIDAVLESIGVKVNAQKNAFHPLLVAVEECLYEMANRIFKPWLHSDFIYKLLPRYYTLSNKHKPIVFGFINNIIQEKRKQNVNLYRDIKNGPDKRLKSFMDLMIETGKMSDVAIREESIVIIVAASDTSAVSLGFTSLMLAAHPEVQEDIYIELMEVLGDASRPVLAEHLPHLKYLDAVIRETLRLYPPVPLIARKIDMDIELPSGITLLAGCGAAINLWAINRNPTYWGEDAELFRPERFLDSARRHPAAFLSFSHGPRNCLGYQYAMMSTKTVLATLLKQYRILPSPDDRGHEPLRVKYDIMMRHVDNYCVQIEPRT